MSGLIRLNVFSCLGGVRACSGKPTAGQLHLFENVIWLPGVHCDDFHGIFREVLWQVDECVGEDEAQNECRLSSPLRCLGLIRSHRRRSEGMSRKLRRHRSKIHPYSGCEGGTVLKREVDGIPLCGMLGSDCDGSHDRRQAGGRQLVS